MMGAKAGAQKAADVLRFCEFGRADRVCVCTTHRPEQLLKGHPLWVWPLKPGVEDLRLRHLGRSRRRRRRHRRQCRRRAVPPVRLLCMRVRPCGRRASCVIFAAVRLFLGHFSCPLVRSSRAVDDADSGVGRGRIRVRWYRPLVGFRQYLTRARQM